jgi:hypothetical protein
VTFCIPPLLGPPGLSVIYDASISDSPRCSISDRFVTLTPLQLKPGHYLVLVHMLGHAATRSFSLLISVSPRLLQSFGPVIYLEIVMSPSGASGAAIRLSNPTPFNYSIIGVTLLRHAPSNLHIESVPCP